MSINKSLWPKRLPHKVHLYQLLVGAILSWGSSKALADTMHSQPEQQMITDTLLLAQKDNHPSQGHEHGNAQKDFQESVQTNLQLHHTTQPAALHQHGSERYQRTTLEMGWQKQEHDADALESRLESRIGSDWNKLYLDARLEKVASEATDLSISALYSRNIATFWDVQLGGRYRHQANSVQDTDRYDAVIGINGLAPYFFETKAHLYLGEQVQLAFAFERDLLLTQRLIVQPYIQANILLQDRAQYALDRGLSELDVGVQTRYEINKRFMPYWQFGYRYAHAVEWRDANETAIQTTQRGWLTGLGVKLMF